MKVPDKIYVCVTTPPIALACSEVPFVNKENNFEYIRKEVVEHIIRSALGPQDALNKLRSL